MGKYRATLVEQVVDAELDSAFYDPTQRTIVVESNIINKEWVVKACWY